MRHSAFIFFVIFHRVLLNIRRSIASSRLASRFVDFPPLVIAIPTIVSHACTRFTNLLPRLPYVRTRFCINAKREYSLERNNRVPNSGSRSIRQEYRHDSTVVPACRISQRTFTKSNKSFLFKKISCNLLHLKKIH